MRNKFVRFIICFFLQEYETANMSDMKLCQNTSIENMSHIFDR